MRRYLPILCAVPLLLLLPDCGSSPDAAAPCIMVNGSLYCTGGAAKPTAVLPEGYTLAGTLEAVRYRPRENLTGQVAEGSQLYVRPTAPEAVCIRVPNREGCSRFILQALPPTAQTGGD